MVNKGSIRSYAVRNTEVGSAGQNGHRIPQTQ